MAKVLNLAQSVAQTLEAAKWCHPIWIGYIQKILPLRLSPIYPLNQMKQLYFLTICALALAACKPAENQQTDKQEGNAPTENTSEANKTAQAAAEYLIQPKQMGLAKIGMSKEELKRLYPNMKDGVYYSEAEIPSWDIADTDGSLLFQATYDEGKIMYLTTSNPKMKTKEGIKVGDSFDAIKQLCPDVAISFAEGYLGSCEKLGYSFMLNGDIEGDTDEVGKFTLKKMGKNVKLADFSVQ